MDFNAIREQAAKYEPDMVAFLREMIAIPSESCEEDGVIHRIEKEMKKVGFDEVKIDGMGNCIGYMGQGDRIIAFDGHSDTVGIGDRGNWKFDPYKGYENDVEIGGRGGSDQEGGIASAVYGARIMKDLGLIPEGYKIMVTATVQEEDCDGLCWQYIHNEEHVTPEFVVSTEPTDGGIYRGHRGRMEIRVDMHGISCHGSAPERGDNAIIKMAEVIENVRDLNENEEIFYTSPSRCAVADGCSISIDRRMTAGETFESCLEEIRNLPACRKYAKDVKVSMYTYERPSWTGLVYPTECYFPTWINKESAPHVQALVKAHEGLFGKERIGAPEAMDKRQRPLVDKWTFSTNCVSIQGRFGIPCVGFGPGAESQAHAPNEITYKQDLKTCAALYAAVPMLYVEEK